MTDRCYILDACAIIALHKEIYRPSVFPDILPRIEESIRNGLIWIPPQVVTEMSRKDDTLLEWTEQHAGAHPRNGDFNAESQKVEDEVGALSPRHAKLAKKQKSADLHLMGWAKVLRNVKELEAVVITQEGTNAQTKIPGACEQEKIPWNNLAGMFAELGWQFLNKAP